MVGETPRDLVGGHVLPGDVKALDITQTPLAKEECLYGESNGS